MSSGSSSSSPSTSGAADRRGRRGFLAPLVLGLGGAAILAALCVWQIQRLGWKTDLIAEIEARAAGPAVPLPDDPDPARDRYLPVEVAGRIGSEELHVLTSRRFEGPGFRVIAPFETAGGRRVMVDRGFVPEAAKDAARPGGAATVAGHLHWPREADWFTPDPNRARNIWFAREVPAMAAALGTEPVLVVAARPTGGGVTPLPVTVRLPNNHLQYAITWGSLAVLWLAMTGLLALRIRSGSR